MAEARCDPDKCPFRLFSKVIEAGFTHFTAHKVEVADETAVSMTLRMEDGKGGLKEVTIKL